MLTTNFSKILMLFIKKIASLVGFLLLTVIFVFILTPLGLVLKLQNDPMARRFKNDATHYRNNSYIG